MPVVAAFIDEMRLAFGKDHIDGILRDAIRGKPVFFASENGHTVGTPVPRGVRVGTNERGNRCLLDGPVAGEAEQLANEQRQQRERVQTSAPATRRR